MAQNIWTLIFILDFFLGEKDRNKALGTFEEPSISTPNKSHCKSLSFSQCKSFAIPFSDRISVGIITTTKSIIS